MSKYVWFCLIFILFSGFAEGDETNPLFFAPNEPAARYTDNELVVKLHSEVAFNWSAFAKFETLAKQFGVVSIEKIFPTLGPGIKPEIDRIYLLRFEVQKSNLCEIKNSLEQSPLIEDVDFNYLRRPCTEQIKPNDARFSEQWNLLAIRMSTAWPLNSGSKDLIIAIVDSGVDLLHEDLVDQLWRNPGEIADNGIDDDGNGYVDDVVGWDFSDAPTLDGTGDYTRRDNDPSDESGHGTHVAGIACAKTNNGIGIAGISWNCRLMPLRAGFNVASGGAFLQDDDVASAIVYAADNGSTRLNDGSRGCIKVINMSWGDLSNAFVISDAVNYAYQHGCVLVASAGNSSDTFVLYPAALPNVISVGATDQNHQIASMSNYGEGVDLFAPGTSILSTQINGGYNTMSGTSMAAPHVSGVAGLILSKYPGLTNDDLRNILISSSRRQLGKTSVSIVDAAKALASRLDLCAKIQVDLGSLRKFRDLKDEIILFGNACGHGFEKFSIEYGKTATPVRWEKLYESDIPAWNEELYKWDTSSFEEEIYSVRLNVFGKGNKVLVEKTLVRIDHTPPKIMDVKVRRLLDGDELFTTATWKTDEDCVCSISSSTDDSMFSSQFRFSDENKREILTNKFSKTHIVNLKDLAAGTYEFFITARNTVGLVSIDDNDGHYYHADVEHSLIGLDRFTLLPIDGIPNMHLVNSVADFDNDGLNELIGMPLGGGYSPVEIYEQAGPSHYELVFTSEQFFPWAAGDSDGDGLWEILGNNYETTFLIESPSPGEYPTERIFEKQGLWGGQFADLDLDGQIEIVSKNTNTNCIDIYENAGDKHYSLIASLTNPTEGDNSLATNYAVEDFDGDGLIELAAGDADGDVFVYESIRNNEFICIWHERLEDSINAYELAVGDFDGDGRDDFVVGSSSADDEFGFENWHRNYFVFSATNHNNSYRQIFSQQIRSFRGSGNGIAAADVDADGIDELVVVAVPNAYVFKNGGNGWETIWHHPAGSTFRPCVLDVDNDGTNEILFNLDDRLGFFGLETDSRLIHRPYGLTASLIDLNSVRMRWQSDIKSLFYKIYRRSDGQFRVLAEHVEENEFVDDSIIQGVTYWYAVSSVMQAGKETFLSKEISVVSKRFPRLVSAKYLPSDQVELTFDKLMGSSALRITNYELRVTNLQSYYTPLSAILDRSGKRVILTFDTNFSVGKYQIIVKSLRDADEMPINQEFQSISFVVKNDVPQELSQVKIYPNPVRPSQHGAYRIIFGDVPTGTEISIYTVSGELIEQLEVLENDAHRKIWWLSRRDKIIASGVYLCIFELDKKRVVKKFCVVE